MSVHHTMSPSEEAQWLRDVKNGYLWPYQQELDASEQMWLWRQMGHLFTEIGFVTGLTPASVWARVQTFEGHEVPV